MKNKGIKEEEAEEVEEEKTQVRRWRRGIQRTGALRLHVVGGAWPSSLRRVQSKDGLLTITYHPTV